MNSIRIVLLDPNAAELVGHTQSEPTAMNPAVAGVWVTMENGDNVWVPPALIRCVIWHK